MGGTRRGHRARFASPPAHGLLTSTFVFGHVVEGIEEFVSGLLATSYDRKRGRDNVDSRDPAVVMVKPAHQRRAQTDVSAHLPAAHEPVAQSPSTAHG